jgi:glutathione S-transferase
MTIKLYDLAGAQPERRFSPYCWRTRLALAHKELPVETIAWRFTDKEAIAASGQGRVPVIDDGGKVVHDSWKIACYLEEAYPDRPSLFGGAAARTATQFVNAWADSILLGGIARLIIADIFAHLHDKDRDYFRATREKAFGASLEAVAADRADRVAAFRQSLQPVRLVLRSQPFLGGHTAMYADYIVFGAFQWARATSSFALIERDDPIHAWRTRMLDAFDGLARKVPGYDD